MFVLLSSRTFAVVKFHRILTAFRSFICTDLVVQGCAPKVASMDLCEDVIALGGFRRNKKKLRKNWINLLAPEFYI